MNNYNFDALKFAVEGISGGANTVIMDNADLPSFMVPVYKRTNAQLFTGGSEQTHPAFIVDTAEYNAFYFSQFINCVVDGRAYSWPLVDPAASLNYDAAHNYCNKKGPGWHLGSIPEWACINHLIRKSGFEPHGNTNFGKAYQHEHEAGAVTYTYEDSGTKIGRTATGSGPATWRHDGTFAGIADWVGDVWKWMSGARVVDGEIQFFVGNLAAKQTSAAAGSSFWKAVLENGSLVDPGTADTLKYTKAFKIAKDTGEKGNTSTPNFNVIAADEGVSAIPEILLALNLAPVAADKEKYKGGFWINNEGERLPVVGAHWYDSSDAGSSALHFYDPRTGANRGIGFFSAFMEL